jgi:hypothetical protein
MNQRRLVLGAAGGGGTLLLVAVLLFAILGPCNLLRGFGRTGSVTHPTPTPTATVTAAATPTPVTTSEPTPTPTPSATAGLIISSLPVHTGEVGVNYSPVQMVASGGKPPYTWSTNPGALPPGLSLTPGGQMAGTPTAAGSYTPTFHVDDSAGGAAGFTAPITIVAALTASPTCSAGCTVEVTCQAACTVFGSQSGGLAPYQYALVAGTLPSGTSLSGLALAGAMTQAFTYKFTVQVTDALQASVQVPAVFNVLPHITLTSPWNTTYHLRTQSLGPPSAGGQIPYSPSSVTPAVTWDAAKAPPGFSASVNSKTTTIDMSMPTPNVPLGTAYTFTITIRDSNQCGPAAGQVCSSTATVTITVNA